MKLPQFCWLSSLRAFYRCLRVTSIVDPSLAPSSEARAILARHSAGIVPLSAHSHSDTPHSDPNYLPHMPDRSAHYAFVSESNSYVPSEGREGGGGGAGAWLGAKVMGAVGWLLGVDSYDVAREQQDRDVEKGEKEAMLLREGRGSEGMPGQRLSGTIDPALMRVYAPLDMDNPTIRHVDNSASSHLPSSASSLGSRHTNADAQRYRGLFDGVTRPNRSRSNSEPTSPLFALRAWPPTTRPFAQPAPSLSMATTIT